VNGRSVKVIAVLKPGRWVVRAIAPGWCSAETLVQALQRWVGRLDPELVWTGYTYEGLPWYLHQPYFLGDRAVQVPRGVWAFPVVSTYDGPRYRGGPDPGEVTLGPATYLGSVT